ncbi:DUF2726 domain-containing protein [Jannaschia aquimarina]|nr:DUF2726 domain-containing protein [Jannaschia aquimarina]
MKFLDATPNLVIDLPLASLMVIAVVIAAAIFFLVAPMLNSARGDLPVRNRPEPRFGTISPFAPARGKTAERPAPPILQPEGFEDCAIRAKTYLMSREQAKLYAALRDWAEGQDLAVSTEVSLSAVFEVSHRDRRAARSGFARIRQKYLDFLLLDRECRPICGVEYHGSGHFRGNAQERDAIKRYVFQAAGLPFVELHHGTSSAEMIAQVARATGRASVRIAAE